MVLNFGGGIFAERDVRETPISEGTISPGDFCSVYRSTVFSLTAASGEENIEFNAEEYDDNGMHSLTVDPERILVTTPGLYLIFVQLTVDQWNETEYKLYEGATVISKAWTGENGGSAQKGTITIMTIRNITASTYYKVTADTTDDTNAIQGSVRKETKFTVLRLQ